LLTDQADRGWWDVTLIAEATASFYKIIFAANSKFCHKVNDNAFIVSRLGSAIRGKLSGADFLLDFCTRFGHPTDLGLTEEDFNRFLSFLAIEQFADSNESLVKEGNDLGSIATNLVIFFTSFDNTLCMSFESVPMLNIHG
jgi:hypothetical protein